MTGATPLVWSIGDGTPWSKLGEPPMLGEPASEQPREMQATQSRDMTAPKDSNMTNPQPLPPEVPEELARIIATHEGYNPDTEVFDCDDDVNTVPAWMNYRQHARAVYAATARSTEAMRAENERLKGELKGADEEISLLQEEEHGYACDLEAAATDLAAAKVSLKAAREALEKANKLVGRARTVLDAAVRWEDDHYDKTNPAHPWFHKAKRLLLVLSTITPTGDEDV